MIVLNIVMKTCPKCNHQHQKQGVFCSRSCANSRGPRTDAFKEQVRTKLRQTFNQCLVCGNLTSKRRLTCSDSCYTENKKRHPPPLTPGGYRKGAGRGKHGWYKGFYLDSTYELAYLIYCQDHTIPIERNTKYFTYTDSNGKFRKYYPDFRVAGKLTEIKGYYVNDLDSKIQSVDEPIDVLFPTDLVEIFEYVENKTKLPINQLHQLYGTP